MRRCTSSGAAVLSEILLCLITGIYGLVLMTCICKSLCISQIYSHRWVINSIAIYWATIIYCIFGMDCDKPFKNPVNFKLLPVRILDEEIKTQGGQMIGPRSWPGSGTAWFPTPSDRFQGQILFCFVFKSPPPPPPLPNTLHSLAGFSQQLCSVGKVLLILKLSRDKQPIVGITSGWWQCQD